MENGWVGRCAVALLGSLLSSCGARAPDMLAWRPVPPARVPGFRLGAAQPGVRPLRERLTLRLVDHARGSFSGVASIDIELRAPTDIVWMHGQGLELDAVWVTGPAGRAKGSAAILGGDRLGVQLGRMLGPGSITVDIAYHAHVTVDETRGVTRTARDNVYTQLAGGAARRAFPCFDEPAFKIPWRVAVVVSADEEAISNMPQEGRAATEGDAKTITFAESPPMPADQVAVAAGSLEMNDIEARLPMRTVFEPGVLSAAFAEGWIPERLDDLAVAFGPGYVYPKVDLFPVSDLEPVTAYPGLVVAPDTLAGDEAVSLLTRALAQAWVGDVVTPIWWDEAWLADGLAVWVADRIDRGNGDYRRVVTGRSRTMADDNMAASRPVRAAVASADDRARALAPFTGEKGAAVLRMIAAWLGDDAFRDGVRRYLAASSGRAAGLNDLAAALDPDGTRGVAGVLHDFLDAAGVPEIEAELECSAGAARVRLKQRVYALIGSQPRPRTWKVPVCATYPDRGQESSTCTLLTGEEGEIALPAGCPEWALAFSGGDGYHHLHVTAELFEHIFSARWMPPPSERAALVGELDAALRSGALDAGAVLALVRTALADRSPLVRMAAGRILVELDELGAVAGADRAALAALLGPPLADRLRELGPIDRRSDDDLDRSERHMLLLAAAAFGGDNPQRGAAADSLDRFVHLQAAGSDVLPRIGARSAPAKTLEPLVAAWLKDRSTSIAIAGFIPAGEAALQLALDARLIHTEAAALLDNALTYPATRPLAIAWMAKHFQSLERGLPRERWPFLLEMMGRACEEESIAVVDRLVDREAPRVLGGAQIAREAKEKARLCVAFRKRVSADLHASLQSAAR